MIIELLFVCLLG